ncbi:MAG: ATP-binding protein [Deltaproteobacteria bacterium]|nr:ATP-binding protein [Deltaproteobacteria bacterium]
MTNAPRSPRPDQQLVPDNQPRPRRDSAPLAPSTNNSLPSLESGAVENLVTQFSNAFDCVRELAQNSIDAGTPVVEVWTEFQLAEGHVGAACLHVDDFGEGMDEKIIDDQLTTLFASSKEGDLTKIGKFGIGFVSVFALRPRAVLVHTGRGGEYWEVLFHEDRSFSKTRIDTPVEGTQVTLFVEADYHRYREIVDGALAALRKWCCHTETRVTVEDRSPPAGRERTVHPINEPFAVSGDCPTRVTHPGTEIVLAYNRSPLYGLYNRGLALAVSDIGKAVFDDRRALRFRRIAAKISSRYLEHTLSRESVLRDKNYDHAMALLDAAAAGPLLDALASELSALVARPRWELADVERYAALLGYLSFEPVESLDRVRDRPLLRDVHGGALSLDQADATLERDGRLLVSHQATALTRRLRTRRLPVLLGRERGLTPPPTRDSLDAVYDVLCRIAQQRAHRMFANRARRFVGHLTLGLWQPEQEGPRPTYLSDPENVYLPVVPDKHPPEELRPLLDAASALLGRIDARYGRLGTFVVEVPGADVPLFVTARRLGPLMARPPKLRPASRHVLEAAVHRDHPHLRRLATLHARRPALAAYCLARSLLLVEDRMLERDDALLRSAAGGA